MLGILLYVVLSIVDQSINPDPMTLDTGDTPDNVIPPAIRTRTDLELALKGKAIDLDAELQSSADWYQQRGFLGSLPVYGRMEESTLQQVYADAAVSDLLQLAGSGDIAAAQALAELSMSSDNNDPVEAIDWYRQAASYGSVYAMFRISELLQIFSNRERDVFNSDALYADRLNELRTNNPLMDRDALAWAITGVLAGGLPVAQPAIVDSITAMATILGEGGTVRACDKANRLLLDLAAERRSRDRLVFATAPPPLFVSAPNLRAAIPCEATAVPIIDSSACEAVSVPGLVNPNQTLWRCE
jgi:TPR repeat protein